MILGFPNCGLLLFCFVSFCFAVSFCFVYLAVSISHFVRTPVTSYFRSYARNSAAPIHLFVCPSVSAFQRRLWPILVFSTMMDENITNIPGERDGWRKVSLIFFFFLFFVFFCFVLFVFFVFFCFLFLLFLFVSWLVICLSSLSICWDSIFLSTQQK